MFHTRHKRLHQPNPSLENCPYSCWYSDSAGNHGGAIHMAKSNLVLVSPATAKRTVSPLRRPNAELRPREHLTEREVEKLIEAARGNRHGHRDASMILLTFRHGL